MDTATDFRQLVREEIKRLLVRGSPPLLGLDKMFCYHMGFCDQEGRLKDLSKGKYMRPVILTSMCAAVGGDVRRAVPAAAAVEITHRTSLVFDDIQDNGLERNNRPTVFKVWGANQAINAGLALSSYARLALYESIHRGVPEPVIMQAWRILEEAVISLCHGQYLDLKFLTTFPTVDEYLEMVMGKTAAIFSATCRIGAMIGEDVPWSPRTDWAARFGLNMGIAFQIHDDYLGIWGDETTVGKTANDLQERKRSLPVVLVLQKYPDEKITPGRYMVNWLNADSIGPEDAARIREWMTAHEIDKEVKSMELEYATGALDDLKQMKLPEPWREKISGVLNVVISRVK